jgi:hypothetical protein
MKKMIAVGSICACLLAHVGSGVALPANEYVCRVLTNSDRVGVVFVQADDAATASNVASAVNATRLDGVAEQVKTVVECIPFPQERFSDTALQAFVDSMPR